MGTKIECTFHQTPFLQESLGARLVFFVVFCITIDPCGAWCHSQNLGIHKESTSTVNYDGVRLSGAILDGHLQQWDS